MIRTQIYLTARELELLCQLADKTGKTRSKIIREVLDAFFENRHSAALLKETHQKDKAHAAC